MLKCLGLAFLLCASSHLGSQTRGSDGEDNDNNNNNEPVPDLNIYSPSSETIIGGNVILECNSTDSCLPINFTLFLNNKTIGQAIKRKAVEKIVFNYTISSRSDLGQYKCKAQSRFNNVSKDKYSKGFNFTLKADMPSPCKDSVSDLNIYSPSLETIIGGDVILECNSTNSCLPINFTLFLNNKTIGHAIKRKAVEKIVFNYTISSRSDLGQYKCKARNRYNNVTKSKYSKSFNFTLRVATEEETNKLVVFIVAPFLLLLLLLTSVVAFRFLIVPWCETKKRKSASKSTSYVPANCASSENYGTYDDEYGKEGQVEYCDVKMKIEEDCRKETLSEDTAVTYAEIMIRR